MATLTIAESNRRKQLQNEVEEVRNVLLSKKFFFCVRKCFVWKERLLRSLLRRNFLGSDFGRRDFSQIFIFEPPDFFADFVAGFFLLIFVGKSFKVARLQSEFCTKDFFRATNFRTKNAPKFSLNFLSLCSVGQKKSPENSLQISHSIFKFPCEE